MMLQLLLLFAEELVPGVVSDSASPRPEEFGAEDQEQLERLAMVR
jgi:hypothetical protein